MPRYDRAVDVPLRFSATKHPARDALLAADEAAAAGKHAKRSRGGSRWVGRAQQGGHVFARPRLVVIRSQHPFCLPRRHPPAAASTAAATGTACASAGGS